MTALMLATVLCFGLFSGCSSDPYPSDGSQSATVPYDIVEGLAYTFAAKNQASIACAFSEISVMGFPANQAAVYLPEGWKRGDTLPTPSTVVIATSSRDVSSKDEPSTIHKKPQSGDKPENRPEELPDGKLTKAENALVGSWRGTDPESGDAVTMDLYSDRSGYMVQTGDNATVRLLLFWQADDGNMTLYFNFLGYRAHNTPYTVSGNTVAFQDEDGRPTTFTRVK